jgi:hypothetical protein
METTATVSGKYTTLADQKMIDQTVQSLRNNGFTVYVVDSGEAARRKFFEILPDGAEVMNMTSMTLEAIGVAQEILESGRYDAVRNRMGQMDEKERRRVANAPDWSVGSVHAITRDGQVLIASRTGSQIPAHAYSAANVIWVAGTQKIVRSLDDAFDRMQEHSWPLETQRFRKARGTGSWPNKVLLFNGEMMKGRVSVILVKEALGF